MFERKDRVGTLLQQEISNMIIFGEIKDPRIQNVIITKVDVSRDLSYAKVYFKTHDDSEVKEIEKILNRASNFIRNKLFKKLSLKKAVNLKFFYDDSDKYAERIDRIIEKIHEK